MNTSINMKGLSLNVRGLNKSLKRRTVFRWLHQQQCSFVFLQETYSSKECELAWEAEWGGKAFFNHGTRHSKGTMILFHPKLDFKLKKRIVDKNGRYIFLDGNLADVQIVLVNIYAPNDVNQQVSFFKDLQRQLEEYAEETIIIGGAFNCTLREKDKKGGSPNSRKLAVIEEIDRLCNVYELNDIWRLRNPNEEQFTWRNKSLKIQCRLDFFLISKRLNDLTDKCKIVYAPESDHSAILLHIKSVELRQEKGPGFWKFNQSLLQDETYVSELRTEIENFKQKYSDVDDLGLRWDLIKMEIRGFTVKYSKNKARKIRSTEASLQNQINALYKRANDQPNNKQIICEIQNIRFRLQKIMQHKTKGAILRSRVRWHESGERNTRYFYNLERRNYEKKTVTKLKRPNNGAVTNDQFEILQEQKDYYSTLYTSSTQAEKLNEAANFFENITPLDDTDKFSCEGKISTQECLKALNEFKNEKSPGTDGLPAEFEKLLERTTY